MEKVTVLKIKGPFRKQLEDVATDMQNILHLPVSPPLDVVLTTLATIGKGYVDGVKAKSAREIFAPYDAQENIQFLEKIYLDVMINYMEREFSEEP